jgi:hypothetical protein
MRPPTTSFLAQRRLDSSVAGGFPFRQGLTGCAEFSPVPAQAIPALGDGFVEPFTGRQTVSRWRNAGNLPRRVHDAPQQIRREQSALGADGLKFCGAFAPCKANQIFNAICGEALRPATTRWPVASARAWARTSAARACRTSATTGARQDTQRTLPRGRGLLVRR